MMPAAFYLQNTATQAGLTHARVQNGLHRAWQTQSVFWDTGF